MKNTDYIVAPDDLAFLEGMARDVVSASTVHPGQRIGSWDNTMPFPFIKPGGLDCYPSFWTRDFAMSLECGLIPMETVRNAFALVEEHMAAEDIHFASGAIAPRGAVPDHIRPDGKAVFFPGTYEYDRYDVAEWGYRPPFDDNFFFIEIAGHMDHIDMACHGKALETAFNAVPCDARGLVECSEGNRGVSFGFCDAVFQTGRLLWASMLRAQAAETLSGLFAKSGNTEKAMVFSCIRQQLTEAIPGAFAHESGLLAAATGTSGQPDTWGSAYAVYCGLVTGKTAMDISYALADYYRQGLISREGQVCHVPRQFFASPISCWERTAPKRAIPLNYYQNGSYWATPTGWVALAISLADRELARRLFSEYIAHLRKWDFRNGGGAPWECIYPDDGYFRNPVYMTSVTCPLAAAMRLAKA